MDEEEKSFFNEVQAQAQELQEKNTQLTTALASSSYQAQEEKNLIEFQLDSNDMIDKLLHFLRADYLAMDGDGNEIWMTQQNKDLILMNEYGVNSIMRVIQNYIDKNTMLSRYDEIRINEILADIGDELVKFIFCNYEKMGMNTEHKKTQYELTVLNIIHIIENAYRRALGGRTSEDLNTSRIMTQTDVIGSMGPKSPVSKEKFNLFKMRTW